MKHPRILPIAFFILICLLAHKSLAEGLGGLKRDQAVKDKVDLIELNHFHDSRGEHVFDQVIFYNWSKQMKRFQVVAWRLYKTESQIPRPRYDHEGRVYYKMVWHDDGVLREVIGRQQSETWTTYDPELTERNFLAQDQRLELSPVQSRVVLQELSEQID